MSEYGYLDQPYIVDLLKHALDHPSKPGTITHIIVEHDDWCPALLGTVHCICRPSVRPPKREKLRRIRQMERQARRKGDRS